mgnify:CR=1 FL=1
MCVHSNGSSHIKCYVFFFQAEDGIRDLVRSRGLGDVYKRQGDKENKANKGDKGNKGSKRNKGDIGNKGNKGNKGCLLYTSDAADERSSVDLGGRRIIKKKKKQNI